MHTAQLRDLREQIDGISQEIVGLLNKRAALAQQIGIIKGSEPVYLPARERRVLQHALKCNQGPLTATELTAIFKEIIAACRNLEQCLRVAYLGPAGTYSEEAARQHLSGTSEFVPCETLPAVLELAEKNERDVAVLPIENSSEGGVNTTLDLLLRTTLHIIGETTLPIHHQLLTLAPDLDSIKEVVAHPQALAQCQNWLAVHLPKAKQHATNSNAEAAGMAGRSSHRAAIAGTRAAEIYNLPIMEANIEDQADNTTRFVVLGHRSAEPTGNDKTSIVCSAPNTPGSLGTLLKVLANAGLNMTKLESRPSPTGLWEYIFYIDIDGHIADTKVSAALDAVRKRSLFLKILGSYPKGT
jgi:chorismate mutase / prephenate dehydratase